MAVKDGRPKIIYTAVNDHSRESAMAQRNRTPVGDLLLEISEKLAFILTSYPISQVVWYVRPLAAVNQEAAKIALGGILLTLTQHGVAAEEMLRSRAQLLLTGTSKPDPKRLQQVRNALLPRIPEGYEMPALFGAAWYRSQHIIEVNKPSDKEEWDDPVEGNT